MAERRSRAAAAADDEELSKAQLQRRIEETRESISHTVEEIKETVSDQYESVKDTVADVIGWNEEFSKNPVVWGLGAMSVGLIIGYSIAVARQDDGRPASRSRRKDSSTDNFFDGVSRVGMNFVLPAITSKIKDVFGVDLSQQLLGLTGGEPEKRETPARKRTTKSGTKRSSKKGASKKRAAKKSTAK
jgi:ParB-like chromosome segregation protein Spo0J